MQIKISSTTQQSLIAVSIAILTTGFLRLQLSSGLPDSDSGFYIFLTQYIYNIVSNGEVLKDMNLHLYQFITSWVYSLEVNQFILLRLIDHLIAIAASIVLFKVILKESDSTLFTVILITTLLILLNQYEIVLYGYRNSIWAAFLPLFSALLVWQNSNKEDKYSFYSIGGLVSLGVLLREPFLPFFIFSGIAILIGYGWRVLIKYLIGSAVVGFSILGFMLMFRGWDLMNLINSYTDYIGIADQFIRAKITFISFLPSIKANWFIIFTATVSIFYLLKLYCNDKNQVDMKRVWFWLLIALIPILEIFSKASFAYHYANCLPGLAGLSALGWKYMINQESKKTKQLLIIATGLISLIIILPTLDRKIIKSPYIFSPLNAIQWVQFDVFRLPELIEKSQYLITSKKIYELSRENSTLSTSGLMAVLFPLTKLMPPTYELHDLGKLFLKLNYDKDKLVTILERHRPTIIILSGANIEYEKDLPLVVEKTNLYNKVGSVIGNQNIQYGWKFKHPGIIYRLKDFE